MKKILVIIFAFAFLINCKTENQTSENKQSNQKSETQNSGLFAVGYSVNPEIIKANEPAELFFEVKNGNGETIKDFDKANEKPMHLLIVSEDLNEFYHLHPEQQSDNKFKVEFTFPNGGYYRLYTDFTPNGGEEIVKDFTQTVVGAERAKIPLKADEKPEKTVDGLRVVMNPDSALENGKEVMLDFQVFDAATNQPVTDLEKYLGEYAHFVIISEDLRDFVHAHPVSRDNVKSPEHSHEENSVQKTEEKLMSKDAASIVSAHVIFPNSAKYKIWAQFQRAGKVITVPFVVEVKQTKGEKLISEAKIPEGAFKVTVGKDGLIPQQIEYTKGKPLKLAFIRIDEDNCKNGVEFKDLNIKKNLPVGEVVTIEIPTGKTGEIDFSCADNATKGKIIIK